MGVTQNLVILAKNNNEPTIDYLNRKPKNRFYILGPGDEIQLKASSIDSNLDETFFINSDGTANTRRFKNIYVSGLTIEELTKILNEKFSEIIINPDVELTVINYRPIRIYIDGEVEEPGIHYLPGSFNSLAYADYFNYKSPLNTLQNNIDLEGGPESTAIENLTVKALTADSEKKAIFPTLYDVIRQSGGITPSADLSNIKIIRQDTISNGGGKIETTVKLLDTLTLKDDSQNIRILDGDSIFVSKNKNNVNSQIAKAIKSNLNPAFINVYFGGRVKNKGFIKISKLSDLNEALSISGGAKIVRGKINFIRYNGDGTIDKRRFSLSKKAKKGSYKNPILKNGDYIFIGNNLLNNTSELVQEVTAPINSIITPYLFYRSLTD